VHAIFFVYIFDICTLKLTLIVFLGLSRLGYGRLAEFILPFILYLLLLNNNEKLLVAKSDFKSCRNNWFRSYYHPHRIIRKFVNWFRISQKYMESFEHYHLVFRLQIRSPIKLCPREEQTFVMPLFCDCDLEINHVTLKLEDDQYIVKMYLHTVNEAASSLHSKLGA